MYPSVYIILVSVKELTGVLTPLPDNKIELVQTVGNKHLVNIVGKEENGNQHYIPHPQCFVVCQRQNPPSELNCL